MEKENPNLITVFICFLRSGLRFTRYDTNNVGLAFIEEIKKHNPNFKPTKVQQRERDQIYTVNAYPKEFESLIMSLIEEYRIKHKLEYRLKKPRGGGRGGYNKGGGNRQGGGYQNRDHRGSGGYQRRDGDNRNGGYRPRRDDQGGGYNQQREGGYRSRRDDQGGGYQRRDNDGTREGGYRPRRNYDDQQGQEGYRPRGNRDEGNYRPRRESNFNRDGYSQGRSSEGRDDSEAPRRPRRPRTNPDE